MADRPGRSTARVDRTKGRSTLAVDRRAQACARLADTGTVGRAADRTRELCSLFIWVDRAVDRVAPTVTFLTVGGRPGRPTVSLSGCQISLTASFLFGLYKPHFFEILAKIFRANFLPFSGVKKKFLKEFKEQKDSFLFLKVFYYFQSN